MKQIIDLIAFSIIRSIIILIRILPSALARKLARGIISIVLFFIPRYKKVGRRNLAMVFPEKSLEKREQILDASFDILSDNIYTFAKIPQLNKEKIERMYDYSEARRVIAEIQERRKKVGALLATMHFGSFEQLIQAQAILDRPSAILARNFDLKRLDQWWNKIRESFGNQVFSRKGAYKEIIRRLSQGQDVAILFDQNVHRRHAIFTELCGINAATTKSIALAAIRTGAPIVFATSATIRPGKYKMLVEEIVMPSDPNISHDEKVLEICTKLNNCATKVIRQYPENWFWIHRRFKTRPIEEVENLYDNLS